jgi:ubiquinone/menaquinone biosynthesis C-methylase UbiE
VSAKIAGDRDSHGAEIAYEAIAPVYDDFTSHHDYELWLGNLLPKLEARGLSGCRLLDVGCGTGKSFIPMIERGWEVTACDISASMVELARAKVGDRATLAVADMRELPEFGEFDLVFCLDDAVNYLLSVAELEGALEGMARNLTADGLLMFDANTIEAYRTFFAEEVTVEKDGWRLLWHGHSSRDAQPGSISEASFEAAPMQEGSKPPIPPQKHRQRHFPEAEVLGALEGAGLECLDVFGHDHAAVPEQPLDEAAHTKAIYIARR